MSKKKYEKKTANWVISGDAHKALDAYYSGGNNTDGKKGKIVSRAILYFLEKERGINLHGLGIEAKHGLDTRLDDIEREQERLRERIIKCEFNTSKKREKAISALVECGVDDAEDLKDTTDDEWKTLSKILSSERDWEYFIRWQKKAIEEAFGYNDA